MNERYGSKDFLVLTYTPIKTFDDAETIVNIQFLKSKIEKLQWVENVISIIDVPLLKTTDEPLMERLTNFKTLAYPKIDKKKGLQEILSSEIYKNYVVSEDGKTSALVVYIKQDKKLNKFIKLKNQYFEQAQEGTLSKADKKAYNIFTKDYENYKNDYNKKNHQNINEIREVISKYGEDAKIHLGGIPMISDDMMTFIKNDIIVFGIGVFIFILITLWIIFRNIKWVVIPLLGCSTSVILMLGILGLIGWKVTVISSNFIALMLILNMAMNIHVTVRYLQIKKENISISKKEAIIETTSKMFWPILYTVLTTICAFLSLILSGIKPIIDFGWMMTLGLIVSISVTFFLLPSLLSFLSKEEDINVKSSENSAITKALGNFSKKNTFVIFFSTIFVIAVSIKGILNLEVENSFINYFDKKLKFTKE